MSDSSVDPMIGCMTSTYAEAMGIRVTEGRIKAFETTLCRRLVEAGYSGALVLNDSVTGEPRITFRDIAKAAKWTVAENDRRGPHFTKYVESPWMAGSEQTA